MTQQQARRKARALGGVAVTVQETRVNDGPWVQDHQWIVVNPEMTEVLAR